MRSVAMVVSVGYVKALSMLRHANPPMLTAGLTTAPGR